MTLRIASRRTCCLATSDWIEDADGNAWFPGAQIETTMTAISGRRRCVANDKSRDRRRLDHGLSARLIGARRLPIGLSLVLRRPIDCLAVLTASVASIVIIINAVFLQSGFRHGTDRPEGLVSKLQKPQEFLKSEGERLRRKIDSAVAGIKSVETRSGARGGR
jgi:hypothetical protein